MIGWKERLQDKRDGWDDVPEFEAPKAPKEHEVALLPESEEDDDPLGPQDEAILKSLNLAPDTDDSVSVIRQPSIAVLRERDLSCFKAKGFTWEVKVESRGGEFVAILDFANGTQERFTGTDPSNIFLAAVNFGNMNPRPATKSADLR
jgi:hypothetical protein